MIMSEKNEEKTMNTNKSLSQDQSDLRKPYTTPEIIAELELETRAGSPLGGEAEDVFGIETQ